MFCVAPALGLSQLRCGVSESWCRLHFCFAACLMRLCVKTFLLERYGAGAVLPSPDWKRCKPLGAAEQPDGSPWVNCLRSVSRMSYGRGLPAKDTLAERLRRRPAKPMGSPRVGSNPTGVVLKCIHLVTYDTINLMSRHHESLVIQGSTRSPPHSIVGG